MEYTPSFTPMYTSDIHLVDYPKYHGQADVQLALLGIPFDQAVCNRPGARFAPRAIRLASSMHFNKVPYSWEHMVNPAEVLPIYDLGDLNLDYGMTNKVREDIMAFVQPWMEKKVKLLTLGGDHSISFPLIKALAKQIGHPISLIQFDSHSDTWSDLFPQRIDHGSMFYHAVKEGFIDPKSSVQIGIRSFNTDPLGICTLDNIYLHQQGITKTMERVLSVVGQKPAYVSFDLDFLDPAFAPGTGTPVCGGFSTFQALEALKMLTPIHFVGMDIVELNPAYDHADITALAAATLMQAMAVLLQISVKMEKL